MATESSHPFVRDLADVFLAKYPHLRAFATLEADRESGEFAFSVECQCREQDRLRSPLVFDGTENGITVGMDGGHTLFFIGAQFQTAQLAQERALELFDALFVRSRGSGLFLGPRHLWRIELYQPGRRCSPHDDTRRPGPEDSLLGRLRRPGHPCRTNRCTRTAAARFVVGRTGSPDAGFAASARPRRRSVSSGRSEKIK